MSPPNTNPKLNLNNLFPLIVDDNPQALDVVTSILTGFGIKQSVRCTTAEEAIEHLGNREFDLAIIDCEMPGKDGFDVLQYIRGNRKGVNFTMPVLMMSAATPQRKVEKARDSGANFVVAKPLSPALLLDRIVWMARSNRDFIDHENYRGPDRRFHNVPLLGGIEERRESILRLTETPVRELSQDEIDGLF